MSKRTEAALACAGALDRAEQALNEANVLVSRAKSELQEAFSRSPGFDIDAINATDRALEHLGEAVKHVGNM